jgi:hypothetical protein
MSTLRQRCGSWLAWAVALAAGCADGGKGGEGADAGSDTAPLDCAASPLDCDGEDNDCDGMIDEGSELDALQLWGVDNDHDGYPAAAPRRGCAGAAGEVEIVPAEAAVDCDDDRFGIHPGAAENCVGAGDEDCSGLEGCADPACAERACTEICDDGVDNDRDGSTDCLDAGCARDPLCVEDCADGVDDDGDGLADCDDPDCFSASCPELCDDGLDNDGDGGADCSDAECLIFGCAEVCTDRLDNDLDGLDNCADPDCYGAGCSEQCDDAPHADEDGDGLANCDDADCFSAACPELCDDGLDNDGDGGADCSDAECLIFGCAEVCTDRLDNDLDGLDNCADPDCYGATCREQCDDAPRADEDGDGLANCEDADCASRCVERCDDADNDEDGLVGCDDPDCAFTLHCWQGLTVEAEGLQLRRTVQVGTNHLGAPQVRRRAELSIAHLAVSGSMSTSAGGALPCWFEADGLVVVGERTDSFGSPGTIDGRQSAAADSLSTGPSPCPAFMLRGLQGLLPPRPLTVSSSWGMAPGDEGSLYWRSPFGLIPYSRFSLLLTSVTPYTMDPTGSGWWRSTAAQSAWGPLTVAPP